MRENTVNDQKVEHWFKTFWSLVIFTCKMNSVEDKKSVKNYGLKAMVETNSTFSPRMKLTVQQYWDIFLWLARWKKMDKWILHELRERNKLARLHVCSSLLTRFNSEPLFDQIITFDDKSVLYNNRKRCTLLGKTYH